MRMRIKLVIVSLLFMGIGTFCGWLISNAKITPARKDFVIKARQYSYDPPSIQVNKGDSVHIRLVSLDVVHGFFLEAYDVDAEIKPNIKTFKVRKPSEGHTWKDTSEIFFIADKTGKFRYRCSHTCGNLHPFMMGDFIVKPNFLLSMSLGFLGGFVLSILYIFYQIVYRTKK